MVTATRQVQETYSFLFSQHITGCNSETVHVVCHYIMDLHSQGGVIIHLVVCQCRPVLCPVAFKIDFKSAFLCSDAASDCLSV